MFINGSCHTFRTPSVQIMYTAELQCILNPSPGSPRVNKEPNAIACIYNFPRPCTEERKAIENTRSMDKREQSAFPKMVLPGRLAKEMNDKDRSKYNTDARSRAGQDFVCALSRFGNVTPLSHLFVASRYLKTAYHVFRSSHHI